MAEDRDSSIPIPLIAAVAAAAVVVAAGLFYLGFEAKPTAAPPVAVLAPAPPPAPAP